MFFVDYFADGTRKSVWAHREMMEMHLGRKLEADEVVHHRNGVPDDNRIENFEVMTSADHASHHSPEPEIAEYVCHECGVKFPVLMRQVRHNQIKKGGDGPFCGRRCAGRHNQRKTPR